MANSLYGKRKPRGIRDKIPQGYLLGRTSKGDGPVELIKADPAMFTPGGGVQGTGGITQLTGNVTAGPGTGSQAATIPAATVTEAMQVLADNTTQNVSTTKHGYAPKAPDDVTKYLDGTGAYSVPAGGGGGTGGIYPAFTTPVDGDFAWVNQGGASATVNGNGGITLLAPANSGDSIRIRKKAAPSTPYTITIAILANILSLNTQQVGLGFRQSSDGKLILIEIAANAASELFIRCSDWTNETTFAANNQSLEFDVSGLIWLRITDDGANRSLKWSTDGYYFTQLFTEGRTVFLTADEVLYFANTAHASWPAAGTLLSWAQT